jgi:hypothetical protein
MGYHDICCKRPVLCPLWYLVVVLLHLPDGWLPSEVRGA